MDFLKIIGESKLQGSIGISGAKNSALPLIALSTLAKNEITLENLPEVVDIKTFLSLLSMLGCGIQEIDNHTKTIITSTLNNTKANYDIVRKMRASILVLGPLLGRFGYCEVSLPGGCAIGARPVDLHIKALKKMGAKVAVEGKTAVIKGVRKLSGAKVKSTDLRGGACLVLAGLAAKGTTIVTNIEYILRGYEKLDEKLNKLGAKIQIKEGE